MRPVEPERGLHRLFLCRSGSLPSIKEPDLEKASLEKAGLKEADLEEALLHPDLDLTFLSYAPFDRLNQGALFILI
jgi:hypothetical protein